MAGASLCAVVGHWLLSGAIAGGVSVVDVSVLGGPRHGYRGR